MVDDSNERVVQTLRSNPFKEPITDIVLFGPSNCGKSSTLWHLIVLLCGNGILDPHIQNAFENAFWDKKYNRYRDGLVFVNYQKEDGTDLSIYVSTQGDNWPLVETNFKFFYQCINDRHKVYEYNGTQFVRCNKEQLKQRPRPQICISPANFNKGGAIQAQRYFLDATCDDWLHERWLRKKREYPVGTPVNGYQAQIIKDSHRHYAEEIIRIIHRIYEYQPY